jgi:pectate lyase C
MIRSLLIAAVCLTAGSAPAQTTPITGGTCVSTGIVEVTATIRITSGTFDGGCKTYVPLRLNYNSHSETESANALLFRVENGARLRNVIIANAPRQWSARAINVYNGATLENVTILGAAGEIYISVRTAGAVHISGITSRGTSSLDRHINAIGINTTVNVTNCIFTGGRKVYRQNGLTTYPTTAVIDRCDLDGMSDQVFRTDSPLATAKLTNSRLHVVPTICTGYAPGRCITANNVVY